MFFYLRRIYCLPWWFHRVRVYWVPKLSQQRGRWGIFQDLLSFVFWSNAVWRSGAGSHRRVPAPSFIAEGQDLAAPVVSDECIYNLLCTELAKLWSSLIVHQSVLWSVMAFGRLVSNQLVYCCILCDCRIAYLSYCILLSRSWMNCTRRLWQLQMKPRWTCHVCTDHKELETTWNIMTLQDHGGLALKIFQRKSCFVPTKEDPAHTQPKIHQRSSMQDS